MYQLKLQAPYQVVPKHVALDYIKELREMLDEEKIQQAVHIQNITEQMNHAHLNETNFD